MPAEAPKPASRRGHNPIHHAHSSGAPQMMARYLLSCGLVVKGYLKQVAGGWMTAEVADRETGARRGRRWIRRTTSGYEIRRELPGG